MRTEYLVKWSWPKNIEYWVFKQCIGTVLNFPSGMSRIGYRADIDPVVEPDIIMDLEDPIFEPQSFDTVICDPPFKMFNKWRWILKLADIARKRFIFCYPGTMIPPMLKGYGKAQWIAIQTPGTFFIRHFLIYDRNIMKL